MTRRLLPPEEWPRLAGTSLDTVWPLLSPGGAQVLVVEADAQIVACWAFVPVWHAEGVWIDPLHRGKGSAARHLLAGIRDFAAQVGARTVWTGADSPEVAALLAHSGAQPVPFDSYVMTMKEPICQPL